MPLPEPVPGLVIRYSYLWRDEHRRGLEEGAKNRPCAIILVSERVGRRHTVTVLPITHSPPDDPAGAVELPATTKRRLGLDDDRSWVVLSEANRFLWPGPDLRPRVSRDSGSVAYGQLPRALFYEIRAKFLALARQRHATLVPRSE